MNKDLSSKLKTVGLKITPMRLEILGLFSKNCKPVNAEYVIKNLKGKTIDQVTVYRTLASFEKGGIIKRVDLRKDSAYYELNNPAHHHHHLVCRACGTVEEFDACSIDAVSKKALSKSKRFSMITDHSLELFGICRQCAKV